jgi:transcriptional antiterminator RfaH
MIDLTPPTSPCEPHWYAVQAHNKQELRAASNLVSSGLTTFLPLVRLPRRSGAGAGGPVPLFPRYLFVQCDLASSAQRIRYTRGVVKLLGTLEGPTAIDDAIIQSIRDRIGDDGFVELSDSFTDGDSVEVTSGPLKGFVGIFHSATSAAQRVVFLLGAVNSQVRVLVDTAVVRRASA